MSTGTFVNKEDFVKVYRDLAIENIPNHLTTLKKVVDENKITKRLVDGLAIFCDWENEEQKWMQLRGYWTKLNKPPILIQ